MIRPNFRHYNMFSFLDRDRYNGACCIYQTRTYIKYGRQRGLSPAEYFSRLTNFDSRDKELVHVASIYVPELCINVITKLSFGRGVLTSNGGDIDKPLGIYVGSDRSWHVIERFRVRYYLTFQWFKLNVICPERPMICMRSPWYN